MILCNILCVGMVVVHVPLSRLGPIILYHYLYSCAKERIYILQLWITANYLALAGSLTRIHICEVKLGKCNFKQNFFTVCIENMTKLKNDEYIILMHFICEKYVNFFVICNFYI